MTGPPVPYAAYLRVYEPLAAFPEPERTYWARYARRARRPGAQDELRRALAGLLPVPPVAVPEQESGDAFVAEVGGVLCVCPWRTRLRAWLALAEADRELPSPVLEAAMPPVVRRQAEADYERWRERNPDARPWLRSALWHVPVRWFLLFSEDEREYGEGDGEPLLRYRTPMVQARRRLARGLRAVRAEVQEGPLVDGLVDVGRWLEEFHPRSLVELDYGGLVHTISREDLAADHSAAEAAEGVAALREGDTERAGEVFERLTERWRAVQERQFAS
ncbi:MULTISPECIES: hypothetical protein [unclassified Streptomyces]|uniref:hypothetical protein n=1 Tax=unclassified Streptomyces TaxID=2593676 RepID=UPI0022B65899|nr:MULTISPECIES: hypothetical protein [unclassified Streptomyces]MCZ7415323.1 hypothetical protein [Streptomyces sp. WMMC897]MCZ7432246.1 hypothetical protein [Streptomyces sp. WMMC1477]